MHIHLMHISEHIQLIIAVNDSNIFSLFRGQISVSDFKHTYPKLIAATYQAGEKQLTSLKNPNVAEGL